jgi:hypothetical protein
MDMFLSGTNRLVETPRLRQRTHPTPHMIDSHIYCTKFSAVDMPLVLDLYINVIKDPREFKHFNWQYFSYTEFNHVFTLLRDKDQLIGLQGMLPIPLYCNGKNIYSGKSENSFLAKNYRGKKLFELLYNFALNDCKKKGMIFVHGFTSAIYVWRNKLNFVVDEGAIKQTWLIVNTKRFWQLNLQSNGNIILNVGKTLFHLIKHFCRINYQNRPNLSGYSLEDELKNSNDIEIFQNKFTQNNPDTYFIQLTVDFYKWRILENPFVKYKKYYFYQGESLEGIAILAEQTGGRWHLSEFSTNNHTIEKQFLSYIIKDLKKINCSILLYTANSKHPVMKKHFFLFKSFSGGPLYIFLPFVLKNIKASGKETINMSNWYVNGLWTEGFNY